MPITEDFSKIEIYHTDSTNYELEGDDKKKAEKLKKDIQQKQSDKDILVNTLKGLQEQLEKDQELMRSCEGVDDVEKKKAMQKESASISNKIVTTKQKLQEIEVVLRPMREQYKEITTMLVLVKCVAFFSGVIPEPGLIGLTRMRPGRYYKIHKSYLHRYEERYFVQVLNYVSARVPTSEEWDFALFLAKHCKHELILSFDVKDISFQPKTKGELDPNVMTRERVIEVHEAVFNILKAEGER